MKSTFFTQASAICLIAGLSQAAAQAQATFRVVAYGFNLGSPGGITEMTPGVFWADATSATEGIFSVVSSTGKLTVIATVPIGHDIFSRPIVAPNFSVYSTQQNNGQTGSIPNVFSVGPHEPITNYVGINCEPLFTQNLPSGNLLGVAISIETLALYLAESDLKGNITTLHQFPIGETLPQAAIYGSDGNYYGVSTLNDGSGYVYQLTPAGQFSKLTTFPANSFGATRTVALLEASDGNFYGTTPNGGTNAKGTIYKLSKSGKFFTPSRKAITRYRLLFWKPATVTFTAPLSASPRLTDIACSSGSQNQDSIRFYTP